MLDRVAAELAGPVPHQVMPNAYHDA